MEREMWEKHFQKMLWKDSDTLPMFIIIAARTAMELYIYTLYISWGPKWLNYKGKALMLKNTMLNIEEIQPSDGLTSLFQAHLI